MDVSQRSATPLSWNVTSSCRNPIVADQNAFSSKSASWSSTNAAESISRCTAPTCVLKRQSDTSLSLPATCWMSVGLAQPHYYRHVGANMIWHAHYQYSNSWTIWASKKIQPLLQQPEEFPSTATLKLNVMCCQPYFALLQLLNCMNKPKKVCVISKDAACALEQEISGRCKGHVGSGEGGQWSS